MRAVSRKRAALNRQRAAVKAALFERFPICQRCQAAPSVDAHEIKTRARGGSIVDPSNMAALCRACHDRVTTHPLEAHAEGWLRHSWDVA